MVLSPGYGCEQLEKTRGASEVDLEYYCILIAGDDEELKNL